MYFLIEGTKDSPDLEWNIKVIDYSEDKNKLESKMKSYVNLYKSECEFVKSIVEPFIKKYKICLDSAWKIYCLPYNYPNYPNKAAEYTFIVEFTKDYLEKNSDKRIMKYLYMINDQIATWTNLLNCRFYEINELSESIYASEIHV